MSEDVLERRVDADGRLVTKRLLSKTSSLPKGVEKLSWFPKSRVTFMIEESVMDPINKMLTTYTRNIDKTHILAVHERCEFTPSPDNPAATLTRRWARFESGVRYWGGPFCTLARERFKYNVTKATKGFQFVLDAMYAPHMILKEKPLDQAMLSKVHPMLRNRLIEKARNLKEVAKEALPLIVMASTTDSNSGNVN